MERLAGNAIALLFKIGQQRGMLIGHAKQINQGIDVFNQDSTEITYDGVRRIIVGRVTTAENQAPTREKVARGMIMEIQNHRIATAGIVRIVQTRFRHGDKLTLVVRCPRRFGIPFNLARPEQVSLAVAHLIDVVFQVFVSTNPNLSGEIIVGVDVFKSISMAESRIFCRPNQFG